jgi:hypothetical protein
VTTIGLINKFWNQKLKIPFELDFRLKIFLYKLFIEVVF